jgi:hypothetical protein
VDLEPAHCGDENCEADHGYSGTITADDLALRVSEAADGEEAVRQVLAFASTLADATAGEYGTAAGPAGERRPSARGSTAGPRQ